MAALHELTNDEVRRKFLEMVWYRIEYWDKVQPDGEPLKTPRERLEGLAFSMLVLLDGGVPGLPPFVVAPQPDEADKEYHQMNEEDWFPVTPDVSTDIAGGLHELFHQVGRDLKLHT